VYSQGFEAGLFLNEHLLQGCRNTYLGHVSSIARTEWHSKTEGQT
jgi:hypothetical protein